MEGKKRKYSDIVKDLEAGNMLPQHETGYKTIWDAAEKFEYPELDIDKAWHTFEQRLDGEKNREKSTTRFYVLRKLSVAAAVTLLFVFGALYYLNVQQTEPVEYVSSAAQVMEVALADGSKVVLNANSSLKTDTDFGKKHRLLTLNGEAFFDVNKNTEMPFVVKTGNLETQVTGTKFNIEFFSSDITTIALSEGSVNLKWNNKKIHSLVPGEIAIVNQSEGEILLSGGNSLDNVLAWKESKLVFENESLGSVIQRLENVLGVKFQYPKHLDTVLITTTFVTLDANLAAEILSQTLDTKVIVLE